MFFNTCYLGGDGDEHALEDTIKTVVGILPDAAEIVINTAINPVSGVTTLLQKVVKRVLSNHKDKHEDAETVNGSKTAVNETKSVDVETAVETMSELNEQLAEMPDSEAKAVVAETLAQFYFDTANKFAATATKSAFADQYNEAEITQ